MHNFNAICVFYIGLAIFTGSNNFNYRLVNAAFQILDALNETVTTGMVLCE